MSKLTSYLTFKDCNSYRVDVETCKYGNMENLKYGLRLNFQAVSKIESVDI